MTIDEYLPKAKLIPTVVAYLLTNNGYVILGERKTEHGNGFLSGIGGKVGDKEDFTDETPDEALVRELKEELDITPTEFKSYGLVRFLNPYKPHRDMQTIPYLVTSWIGDPTETAAITPVKFQLSAVPYERMWKDNKIWVPKILAGNVINCITMHGEDGDVVDYRFE